MPALHYNEKAPKKATNLSINSELLRQAKKLNINLSATLEAVLQELIRSKQRELWKQENKQAIEVYNKHVQDHGVFSKTSRCF